MRTNFRFFFRAQRRRHKNNECLEFRLKPKNNETAMLSP